MRGARAATAVQTVARALADFRALEARWPQPEELFACDETLPRSDPWHHEFVFEATPDGDHIVRCAGADKRLGTGDDVTSWPVGPDGSFGAAERPAALTSR